MLLAIDTSAGTSVAIVDAASVVLAELDSVDPRGHAERIGELIAACLDQSGVAVSALTAVVAGMGPGPFTGLRVGIAAARAFALGAHLPVIPVVSHDAVAFGCTTPTLVSTDARRRELYWSAYSGSDDAGLPVRTRGPALARAGELPSVVEDFDSYRLMEASIVSAGSLGAFASTLRRAGRGAEHYFHGSPSPLYLRSPDVTLSSGPKRVTS